MGGGRGVGSTKPWKALPLKSRRAKPRGIFLSRPATRRAKFLLTQRRQGVLYFFCSPEISGK